MSAQSKRDLPTWFKDSIVCWYDPKRQGCTNENMAENPILKDLSGNGLDMTCYNFAWTDESGIASDRSIAFDGVNNVCIVENDSIETSLKNDFTVIAKRIIYPSQIGKCTVISNSKTSGIGAFIFEIKDGGGFRSLSYGGNSQVITPPFNELAISVLTKTSYNGQSFIPGNVPSTNALFLGGARHPDYFSQYLKGNIYSAFVFNRTLTDEEIEYVKTNLID